MERLNFDKVKILAAAATLAMFAGVACADTTVFGVVNTAIEHTTDGETDSTLFPQNQYLPTTLGLKASTHLNKCVMFGGVTEVQFNVNSSRLISQINNTYNGTYWLTARRASAWASAGMWGKLSLGLDDAATLGITDMSFAGTNETVIGVNVMNTAGGMYFYQKGTARATAPSLTTGLAGSPQVNQIFDSLDGIGYISDYSGVFVQKNRVRYDTANFYGFSAAVSYGNFQEEPLVANSIASIDDFTGDAKNRRSFTDVALRFKRDFCDFKVGAALGWAMITRDGDTTDWNARQFSVGTSGGTTRNMRTWAGSVAAEHTPTGINAAVAYGNRRKFNSALNNYNMWYGQIGVRLCLVEFGRTNVALDYMRPKNAIYNNDNGKSWGLGVQQDFNKVNSALYASVRTYKYNPNQSASVNYDTVTAVNAGFLFKFGAML